MRQHAHPMPRRRRRWRPVALSVAAAVVLVVVAALGGRTNPQPSAVGLVAGPNDMAGLASAASAAPASDAAPAVTPTPTTAVTAAPSLSPTAAPSAQPATPNLALLRTERLGLNIWPLSPSLLTGYVWPIAHPRLTLPFGPTPWGTRVVDGQLFHDGIDLATFCGDRITAAHDGVVLAAGRKFDNDIGWVGDLGPYYRVLDKKQMWSDLPIVVITDDGNGYRSIYAHFMRVVVRPGQHVRAGQLIGYEGMTGHATGCHLHFGLFSPEDTATFGIEPKVVKQLLVPTLEIARVDPMLVLPFRKGLGGTRLNLGSS